MKIHFLGTASALVTRDRDNTSILVESGSDLLLLDCGGNPAGKILKFGFSPVDLNAIFLTHLHIDHCYGLPALLFHMFLEKRETPMTIFCPEEEIDLLNLQLHSHGIDNDVRTFPVSKIPVDPICDQKIWESDCTAVYSSIANHSRATRAYKMVEKQTGCSIVFTGDTTPVDEMIRFAKGADLLIHEATYLESHRDLASEYGHSTAGQAGSIAAKANVSKLALVHFECSTGDSVDQYRAEAAQTFKGLIFTPDDMSTISL